MSKIARYQGNVRAFASDAQGIERTVFGGTNQADDLTSQITASFLRGWGIVGASEHPSLEDFNAAMYAMSQFIAYQHQMGVPEWHAEQEYHIGSICTHNGESYQSLQNANIGSQPPSAKWTPVLTSKNGLANLNLQFFLSEPSTFDGSFTSVLSPDEKLRIVLANNGVWGVQDNVGNVVPLPLERGGLGATDVSGALRVLGLDYGSLLPVGVPIPWIFETPPTGFLKYNGASFNKAMYPKLAQIFPSGVLLDLRGVFIRGWDDGKGIDVGRAILTQQQDAQQNITGMVSDMTVGVNAAGTGAFSLVDLTTSGIAAGVLNSFYQKHVYLDSSRVVRTATENRPVNIAFNYIVRAA